MKKLDVLIFKEFVGPFILTLAVVIFIFELQFIVNYFEEIVGKGLNFWVYAELFFYLSINISPTALPLAVLLASLITFGNLGEHFELTAIKSSGISLIRVLMPLFIFTFALMVFDMWYSDRIVPKANLYFYSMLYDIKTKKATLSLKEGTFYSDIPGYSIRVSKKYPDGKTLKDLIIYNHSQNQGNTELTLADSGKMYMIYDERYLVLELFNGSRYNQQVDPAKPASDQYVRNRFTTSKIVFDMASFDLKETQKELFASNKYMKDTRQLNHDVDSMQRSGSEMHQALQRNVKQYYTFHQREDIAGKTAAVVIPKAFADSLGKKTEATYEKVSIINVATQQVHSLRDFVANNRQQIENVERESREFEAEKWKKYTQSVACLVMFFIGAPLGAIIKKGGLGMPVLVSIIFFILYYVLSNTGTKWANDGIVSVPAGLWGANLLLFGVGLFFLDRARNDSRLLEADIYRVALDRFRQRFFPPKPKTVVREEELETA
jgi:lipopolysaccharide export system permease protein